MQCHQCGFMLPAGVPGCPHCGVATPYNAGPPSQGNGTPFTGYGSSPQQGTFGVPPSGQYGPPSGYGAQGQYGPPMPQQGYYPPPQQGYYVPYSSQPKKGGGGFCAGLSIGLVILLIALCAFVAINNDNEQKAKSRARSTASAATAIMYQATMDTRLTPSPYSESLPPSGHRFSGTAQSIITNAQVASEIASDNQPTKISSTFRVSQTFYITYKLMGGYKGYVYSLWYFNGQQKGSTISKLIQYSQGYSYVSGSYSGSGQGAVELYWCNDSGCNQGGLAWVRTFTIIS